MSLYRIVDANINRVAEGIRVLEDISRFEFNNKELTEELRSIRHGVRKTFSSEELIENRDSIGDVGFKISKESILDKKEELYDLIISNFKRAEEGIRTIEETLKVLGHYEESKKYESLRYRVYNIEKIYMKKNRYEETDIYAITDESLSQGRSNEEIVKELIKAGVKVIQYRDKDKNKRQKYEECKVIRELTKEAGVTFIVNDDVDIAMAVKADGIHIGQKDMPISVVREIAPNFIIGVSTNNKETALKAACDGADYIGVGPIFFTKTKKDLEKCDGLDYLKWVSENIDIPYVAIGGIEEVNLKEVKANGGTSYAIIHDIVTRENIGEKIKAIRKALE